MSARGKRAAPEQSQSAKPKRAKTVKETPSKPFERPKEFNDEGEELFCICHLPYDPRRFMIGCDGCEGWFHAKCVNVSKAQAESSQQWTCPECVERTNELNKKKRPKQPKRSNKSNDPSILISPILQSQTSDESSKQIPNGDETQDSIVRTETDEDSVNHSKPKRRHRDERQKSKEQDESVNQTAVQSSKKEKKKREKHFKKKHRADDESSDRKKPRRDRDRDRTSTITSLDAAVEEFPFPLDMLDEYVEPREPTEMYPWLLVDEEYDSSSEDERVYMTSDEEVTTVDDFDAILVEEHELFDEDDLQSINQSISQAPDHEQKYDDADEHKSDVKPETITSFKQRSHLIPFGELGLSHRSLLSSQSPEMESDLTLPQPIDESLSSRDLDHLLLRHLHVKKMEVECQLLNLERDRRIYLAGIDYASREAVMRTMNSFSRSSEQSVLLAEADLRGEEAENDALRIHEDDASQSMFSPRTSFTFTPRAPSMQRRMSASNMSLGPPALGGSSPTASSHASPQQDFATPSFPLYCTTLTCAGCDGLIPLSDYSDHLISCSLAGPEACQFDWVSEVMTYLSGQWELGRPMGGEPRILKATVDRALSIVERRQGSTTRYSNAESERSAQHVLVRHAPDQKSTPVGTSTIRIQGLLPLPPLLHPPPYIPHINQPFRIPRNRPHSVLKGDEDHTRKEGIIHDYYNLGLNSVSGRFPLSMHYLSLLCGHPVCIPATDSMPETYSYCQKDKHDCTDHLLWEEIEKTSIEQRYLALSRRLELLKSELDSVQSRVNERVMQEAEHIGNILGDALLCERDEELEERQREDAGRDARIAWIITQDEQLQQERKLMNERLAAPDMELAPPAPLSIFTPVNQSTDHSLNPSMSLLPPLESVPASSAMVAPMVHQSIANVNISAPATLSMIDHALPFEVPNFSNMQLINQNHHIDLQNPEWKSHQSQQLLHSEAHAERATPPVHSPPAQRSFVSHSVPAVPTTIQHPIERRDSLTQQLAKNHAGYVLTNQGYMLVNNHEYEHLLQQQQLQQQQQQQQQQAQQLQQRNLVQGFEQMNQKGLNWSYQMQPHPNSMLLHQQPNHKLLQPLNPALHQPSVSQQHQQQQQLQHQLHQHIQQQQQHNQQLQNQQLQNQQQNQPNNQSSNHHQQQQQQQQSVAAINQQNNQSINQNQLHLGNSPPKPSPQLGQITPAQLQSSAMPLFGMLRPQVQIPGAIGLNQTINQPLNQSLNASQIGSPNQLPSQVLQSFNHSLNQSMNQSNSTPSSLPLSSPVQSLGSPSFQHLNLGQSINQSVNQASHNLGSPARASNQSINHQSMLAHILAQHQQHQQQQQQQSQQHSPHQHRPINPSVSHSYSQPHQSPVQSFNQHSMSHSINQSPLHSFVSPKQNGVSASIGHHQSMNPINQSIVAQASLPINSHPTIPSLLAASPSAMLAQQLNNQSNNQSNSQSINQSNNQLNKLTPLSLPPAMPLDAQLHTNSIMNMGAR